MQHVRNFWLRAHIDGRTTTLQGGPQAKAGGLTATLLVRDHGSPVPALRIDAYRASDDRLVIRVESCQDGQWVTVHEQETIR
jgi:hypothetical protein